MSALRELAASTETMFDVTCRLVCDSPVRIHDPAVATHLYRIAQEAVSNAIKHGKAPEIVILLQADGKRVSLSVRDKGGGFPKVIPKEKGMGMHIMQSRAGMIGGLRSIEKEPVGGTRLSCSVPGGP